MSTITKDVKEKVPKKKLKFVLIAIIVIVTSSYFYFNTRRVPMRRIIKRRRTPLTPCFLIKRFDLLPKMEWKINPLASNIFFIEKECEAFSPRFACAVEAAALANPEMQVNVLFIGPVYDVRQLVAIQTNLPNINFLRIQLEEFAIHTNLELILNKRTLRRRRIIETGTLDVLKYWLLKTYGGIYLDKSMIVIGPLAKYMKNWVVRRSRFSFATEPLGLADDHVGDKFFKTMANEILKFFQYTLKWNKKPDHKYSRFDFSYFLEKTMKSFCETSYVPHMTSKTCRGLNIYDQEKLYPLEWDNWFFYLESGDLVWNEAYLFPLLKNIPKKEKILNTSRYAKVVSQFCPATVHAQGNDFEWLKDYKIEEDMQNNSQ